MTKKTSNRFSPEVRQRAVRMALAGHQLPRAHALALGVPAAQEAAVVQEEPLQVQV